MRVSKEQIEQVVKSAFINCGCTQEEANINAKIFVMTEMCGVTSHGLRMVFSHLSKYLDGVYNFAKPIIIEVETNTLARVNSEGMCGMYSAWQCMNYAISKAKKSGAFTVFANNCNTYGAAFIYPLLAAEKGLIGLSLCNSPAQMAPIGGAKKMLGTNPIAYAIPVKDGKPIVFDASTSIVAKSKINLAVERGEDIPIGWALDGNGEPTTNAKAAQRGSVLPMAGPKGYGLSLLFDILAGVLSGAGYLDNVESFYGSDKCMNVGQVFVAIDPVLIYGDSFAETMRDYVNEIRKSSQQNDAHLPGDRKWMAYDKAINEGIEINDDLYNEIVQYGKKIINEPTNSTENKALRAGGGRIFFRTSFVQPNRQNSREGLACYSIAA